MRSGNFFHLPNFPSISGLTEIDDNDDVRKVEKTLEKQISELQATITRIQVISNLFLVSTKNLNV